MSSPSVTRRVVGWTGAVGAMALLVVGMVSMKNGPETRDPEPPSAQLVAVVDGDIVILNADNGDALRTLAEGDAVDIAVSPDGLFAYFTRVVGSGECVAGEIVRVPIAEGGDEEVIATGSNPVVSPDARLLAYEGLSPVDICPPIPSLVIRDLETGDEHTWPEIVSDTNDVSSPSAVEPLAWAPDARILAYAIAFPGSATESFAVDTAGTSRFLSEDSAALPLEPIAYTSDGALVVVDGESIVLADPVTGDIEDTLVEAAAPIAEAWSDGRRVAYSTGDGVFVWTPGDEEPQHLDVDVQSVAWMP